MRPPTTEVQTIVLSDDLRIDLAPDGTVYGVELLSAREQLAGGTIEFVNEETGRTDAFRFAI